jgi:hypothetical protein
MTKIMPDYYFAGLFDGEGSVSMSLRKDGYIGVVVAVVMCDRAPIVALYDRFGGRFEDGKYRTHTGRSMFRWTAHNTEAIEALEVFSSLCLVKNTVAAAAIPCVRSMRNNPGRLPLSREEKEARLAAAEFIASINKPVGKRRILDPKAKEDYLRDKSRGGGKAVRLSDGRTFESISAAAHALEVTVAAVGHAKRKNGKVRGFTVEAL